MDIEAALAGGDASRIDRSKALALRSSPILGLMGKDISNDPPGYLLGDNSNALAIIQAVILLGEVGVGTWPKVEKKYAKECSAYHNGADDCAAKLTALADHLNGVDADGEQLKWPWTSDMLETLFDLAEAARRTERRHSRGVDGCYFFLLTDINNWPSS